MRLKKLVAHGFKSFADRTEFVFDQPITGIVGPNGCGKSNVVDAIKWVLGEQSAKSLRGDAMMDVIFNGSAARKPSGMAEVTLVFENPRRPDGTRLLPLESDEVSVGRRLFRDGTSEYQLNGTTARLKDIRELFLDTGVGVDAYSVIEQGRVAALLEANPEERRQIFEEAAGISRFKVKKKEAQRKLERVEQNLLRVQDIVEEVERRLRSVKAAAGKARNFQEYSARLNELRLSYSLREYHGLRVQIETLEKQREDLQFRLDDAAGNLAHRQNELARKRQALDAVSDQRQKLEFELVEARAQIQSARQKQQFAREQLQHIEDQIRACEQDSRTIAARLDEVTRHLEQETQCLEHLTGELDRQREMIEARQAAFKDGQLRINAIEREIEQSKDALLEMMRRLAQLSSRLNSIEIERRNIAQQQARLAERRRAVGEEIEQVLGRRDDIRRQLKDVCIAIDAQQAALATRRDASARLDTQIKRLSEELAAAREHRSALQSRQKVLADLEARREGVSEGVKAVLQQRDQQFGFISGLVADRLHVEVAHAAVIEAALDGRDQWLIATDAAAVVAAREALQKLEGRVNILCLSEGSVEVAGESAQGAASVPDCGKPPGSLAQTWDWSQHSDCRVRLARELVRVEPADQVLLQWLLGDTVVVDDLPSAVTLRRVGPFGVRYVTMAGEVLEADGTIKTGPLRGAMGLISRRSELESIEAQLRQVEQVIEGLAADLRQGSDSARKLEQEQNELRQAIYQLNTSRVELSSQESAVADRLASLEREQPLLERELGMLADQLGRLLEEEATLTRERADLELQQQQRGAAIEHLQSEQGALAGQIRLWAEELTAARVALGQVQEKQVACRQTVERQTALQQELRQQSDRVARSMESLRSRVEAVEAEIASAQVVQQQQEHRESALAGQVSQLAAQIDEAQATVNRLVGEVDSLRGEHGAIEQELHAVQVTLGEQRVRLEALVTRTQDELNLDLPARYEQAMTGPQPDSPPIPTPFEDDPEYWQRVSQEIQELREKIQRLGNVNLDALEELQELEQRQQFYATQIGDLTSSRQQLTSFIEEINRESGLRFEQTFNAVKENFQAMFRKLFGGGSADIFLETEVEDTEAMKAQAEAMAAAGEKGPVPIMRKTVDPLEAGIEIIARPPGKKPVTISQLSGGEKAMTCIALLMSIFKSKPSPFCILDEVDAPLDEANNLRFGEIVQEFLSTSQFIIITHHKRTMQFCDLLYGITQQEQGVSKRVAVKFDQVQQGGNISAAALRQSDRLEEAAAA